MSETMEPAEPEAPAAAPADRDQGLIETPTERKALKSASIAGVVVNMGSQGLRIVLQFAYQILIARLLSPRDFGVVALAAPLIVFVTLFADLGLTQATVQRKDITQGQLSFIFWLNFGAASGLAVVTMALAPLVAWFYKDPRVAPVVVAMGAIIAVSGLYTQHLALLNRRLRFLPLAIIDLGSFVAGAIAGVAAARFGLSYWAIVINQAVLAIVAMALAWTFTRWIPSWPKKTDQARSLLGTGANITTFNMVNYFARNLDNILIGRFCGEVPLGLYDRAYKLFLLPLSQINTPFSKVAVPLLARTLHDPPVYRRAYLRIVESIVLLTAPAILFALCVSHELIVVLLGQKWAGVAPIFAILAFGGLYQPINNSTGWLFMSQNRTREMRNWGLISSATFVISFIVGLPWGPVGVAACYIAVGALQCPALWWLTTRSGPVSLSHMLAALAPYGVAAAVTGGAIFGLQLLMPQTPLLLLLAAPAYAIFIAVLALFPASRAALGDFLRQGLSMLAPLKARFA